MKKIIFAVSGEYFLRVYFSLQFFCPGGHDRIR